MNVVEFSRQFFPRGNTGFPLKPGETVKPATPESQRPEVEGTLTFTDGLAAETKAPEGKTVAAVAKPEVIRTVTYIDGSGGLPTMPQKKAVPEPAKLEEVKEKLLQRGDVFESPQGERVIVEGARGDTVTFRRELAKDVRDKDRGAFSYKPRKSFDVSVGIEKMERIDPIKEKYPKFYADYEKEMAKTEFTFTREFAIIQSRMDKWNEAIERVSGGMRGKKKFDSIYFHSLKIKIEETAAKFNELDDRLVEDGRQRMRLFAEMQSLGTEIPSDIQLSEEEQKKALEKEYGASEEELEVLKKKYGSEEPNTELVERGYFRTLFDQKVEELQRKSVLVRDGKLFLAESAPKASAFKEALESWPDKITDHTPAKDIEEALTQLDELDKQTFSDKPAGNGDENGNGNGENKRKGKQVRRVRRGAFDTEDAVRQAGDAYGKKGGDQGKSSRSSAREIGSGEEGGFVPGSPEEILSAFKGKVDERARSIEERIRKADKIETLNSFWTKEQLVVPLSERVFLEAEDVEFLGFASRIARENVAAATLFLAETNERLRATWHDQMTALSPQYKEAVLSARVKELYDRMRLSGKIAVLADIADGGLAVALKFSQEHSMTRQAVIDFLGGIDEVVVNLVAPLVLEALSPEWSDVSPEWSDEEKKRFAADFAKEQVDLFVKSAEENK